MWPIFFTLSNTAGDDRTATVLEEPHVKEPKGLGAVVEAGGIQHLGAGGGIWIALHEDAREPGGVWTQRRLWADLVDPVVLSEGLV